MDLSRFRYQGADARELKPATKTLGSPPRRTSKAVGKKINGKAEGKTEDRSVSQTEDQPEDPTDGKKTGDRVKAAEMDDAKTPQSRLPLPTLLKPRLRLVFVGFNPGIMSSEKGHYYAHPSNSFWKNLNKYVVIGGGLTCYDDSSLMDSHGIGFTDLVARPTRGCEDLSREEMALGAQILVDQISANKPALVCIVGRGIWATVFRAVFKHQGIKKSEMPHFGLMPVHMGTSRVFVVPSTSGLVRDKRLELWRELGQLYRGKGEKQEDTDHVLLQASERVSNPKKEDDCSHDFSGRVKKEETDM